MLILMGAETDPCCLSLKAALEARGFAARIISNPFVSASRLTWRLDNEDSISRLILEEAERASHNDIEGVFVRCSSWVEAEGWRPEDLSYMQSETYAALLGWLWSLPCPVVNRYLPSIWYRLRPPLLLFQPLLWRCGLPTLEFLVSNVESETRGFNKRLATGVVYAPLTSNERHLIGDESDWKGLAAMQRCAPVCLTQPHGRTALACVVGKRVIWNGAPPIEASKLEPGLIRFAAAAGLSFTEVVLAAGVAGLRVVAVEPHPRFELFEEPAQQEIVSALADLLTAGNRDNPIGSGHASAKASATQS